MRWNAELSVDFSIGSVCSVGVSFCSKSELIFKISDLLESDEAIGPPDVRRRGLPGNISSEELEALASSVCCGS